MGQRTTFETLPFGTSDRRNPIARGGSIFEEQFIQQLLTAVRPEIKALIKEVIAHEGGQPLVVDYEESRESEEKRKRKGEGSLFQYNGYWFYTYGYTVDGEQRKKKKCLGPVEKFKTEAAAWSEAKRVRDRFVTDVTTGKVTTSDAENVTCGELLAQYVAHLNGQKKPAAYVIGKCIEANIRPFFGSMKVAKLETRHFERYREMRTKTVSNTTVDHDLAYLKSALLLEYKKTPSRVVRVPHIPKSGEDNVRLGFLEFDGYEKVLAHLPISLKCLFVLGYHVGNRKGALLELKWPQIDFKNGVVRFIRVQNRKPVPLAAPIYGDMGEWLRHQKAYRNQYFPECEFVSFWYPIDCEIDPTLKRGHGGRPGMNRGHLSGHFISPGRLLWRTPAFRISFSTT
jgi:hypothetical protein